MRKMIWLFWLCGCLAQAADWYAAPNGQATNAGTLAAPLDLITALRGRVQAGDTLWLRGGKYGSNTLFYSTLAGQPGNPIRVRNYQDERAIIDGSIYHTAGGFTYYWGLEITRTATGHASLQSGAQPSDLYILDGFSAKAPGLKLINLVIHDCIGNGIGAWSEAPDLEVYGCLIYYNGWQGADRGHGHGIYAQNNLGLKAFTNNIICNGYQHGIQVYGSSGAFLQNITLSGNTIFNPAALSKIKEANPITLYGPPAGGIVVCDNLTYATVPQMATVRLGLYGGGVTNADLQFLRNYVAGGLVQIAEWKQVVCTGNILHNDYTAMELYESKFPLTTLPYRWDNNLYISAEQLYAPFNYFDSSGGHGLTWDQWRVTTGLDKASTYVKGQPSGAKVFIRTNAYDPGRAILTIYNWDKIPAVAVNLATFLATNAPYEIRNAQDYYAPPLLSNSFDGRPLQLPMSGLSVAPPVGNTAPAPTGPEFNCFVLLSQPPPPPPPAATNGVVVINLTNAVLKIVGSARLEIQTP